MAESFNSRPAQFDRFGNHRQIVGLKIREGKRYGKGFFTVGNRLFMVEVCDSRKSDVQAWVTITERKQNGPQNRRGF